MEPDSSLSPRRKFLFVAALAAAGAFGAAATGGALIYYDKIRFGWTERLRRQYRIRRAAGRENRVLVLGDSFLAWWPVERCLHKDLELYFTERGDGYVNTCAGGFGPYEYADQMRQAAAAFRPNLVLLFYYAGNDLTDVLYRTSSTPRRPQGAVPVVTPRQRASEEAIFRGLLRMTATIQLAQADAAAPDGAGRFDWGAMERHGIDPDLIRRAKESLADPNGVGKGHVNPYMLELALKQRGYLEDNLLIESEESRRAWSTAEAKLGEVAAMARELNGELCVIAIPSTAQLDRSHFEFYSEATYAVSDRLLEAREPQRRLRAFCDKRGLPFLDLLPVFEAHGNTERLYWEYDDHLSEEGHIAAFEAVKRELLDRWAGAASPAR